MSPVYAARARGQPEEKISIRTALGASRWRVVRQLLTESLLLSSAGRRGGVPARIVRAFISLLAFGPGNLPRAQEAAVDGRVLGFTVAVIAADGNHLRFGSRAPGVAAPISTRPLKEGGRSATEMPVNGESRNLLVATEIALSLVLLAGAGLLMRSFIKLQAISPDSIKERPHDENRPGGIGLSKPTPVHSISRPAA